MLVLEFALDDVRYGLPTSRVLEVALRVLVTPLPGALPPVVGVIQWRGVLTGVVDLRARLGHSARGPRLDDHFIIAQTANVPVALIVDRVRGFFEVTDESLATPPSPSAHISAVAALPDGLLLIEDLDAALTPTEEAAIAQGIERLEAAR